MVIFHSYVKLPEGNHEKNMEISLRNHSKYLSWLIGEILGSDKLPKFFGDDYP